MMKFRRVDRRRGKIACEWMFTRVAGLRFNDAGMHEPTVAQHDATPGTLQDKVEVLLDEEHGEI